VKAVDEAGVWVENRKFVTVELQDSDGKPVPEKEREPRQHTVNILLPWRTIQTIVMFEEDDIEALEIDDASLEQAGRIGFIK